MKFLSIFHDSRRRSTWFVVISLIILTIGVIIACGKLSNESTQPTTPSGTSGGVPIPVGPQSCWGTYCLSLKASRSSFPADTVSYTTLQANLTDTSGRSLENFLVTFNTATTSDGIAYFVPWAAPNLPAPFATSITGLTQSDGGVSARMYGVQSGSVVVQASVGLNVQDTSWSNDDLFTTTLVILTPSSGDVSAAGSYRLSLTADPMTIMGNGTDFSTLTAKVTDTSKGSVSGLAVTFSALYVAGTLTPASVETDAQGCAYSKFTVLPPLGGSALITAQVYIPDLRGYLTKTIRISVISLAFTATPGPTVTPAPTAAPAPTATPTPLATATPTPIALSLSIVPTPPAVDVLGSGSFAFRIFARDSSLDPPVEPLIINLVTSGATFTNGLPSTSLTTDGLGYTPMEAVFYAGVGTVTVNYAVASGQGYIGSGAFAIDVIP